MALHAFYSPQAAEQVGGVVEYENVNGTRIECTNVSSSREGEGYMWPDKIYRGEVEKFRRVIVPSKRMY